MESLKGFEWYRNTAGYRLAWMPRRGKDAFWVPEPCSDWSGKHVVDRSAKLRISTTQYDGEKRVAKQGMYVGHTVQILNRRKPDEVPAFEIVQPFQSNELVSLNLLESGSTPLGWLSFVNKYGMIGHHGPLDKWHLVEKGTSKDKRPSICEVEHEGALHHLRNVLGKMKRPDLFTPAAFVLRDDVNRYMDKALSLETNFDTETLEFTAKLRYGSFGAALVAEAVEFMAGHFDARQCSVCGSWFRVGAGQMRQDRRFCSVACKMRDYRARKAATRKG